MKKLSPIIKQHKLSEHDLSVRYQHLCLTYHMNDDSEEEYTVTRVCWGFWHTNIITINEKHYLVEGEKLCESEAEPILDAVHFTALLDLLEQKIQSLIDNNYQEKQSKILRAIERSKIKA